MVPEPGLPRGGRDVWRGGRAVAVPLDAADAEEEEEELLLEEEEDEGCC